MEENNQSVLSTKAEAVGKSCCGGCSKKSCWKWIFLVALLFLAVSLVYAGYQFSQFSKLSQKQTSLPLSTPVIQPSPTPTPDPTANWKTYTNEKYGFSVKYPETWVHRGSLGEQEETILGLEVRFSDLKENMTAFTSVIVRENTKDLDLFQKTLNLAVGEKLKLPNDQRFKIGETIVENYPAVIYSGEFFPGGIYFQNVKAVEFKKNNRIYTLSLAVLTDKDTLENQKIFDQILFTFRFLE